MASTAQLDGMAAGQALWQARGAQGLGLRAGATLEVRFRDAAFAYHGLYDDEEGVIYINTSLTEPSLEIVIAHELGHAFGLFHVTDRPSVMSPGNLTTPPTDRDQRALAELWGTCE
jgi:predicted Zn-dependent protease